MTDLTYRSAEEMLSDLAAKRISARELLSAHTARNDKLHAKLNMVVAKDVERAQREAQAIDDARAKGSALGVLAGLPMTVKDGFDVDGLPAVCGNPEWAHREPKCEDALLVSNVRNEGAVVWGKTNVPLMLSDWQSFNAVYGTTNNPHDVSRVPGGSSGGSAAVLASGVSPLEIGSDIGGSLRVPAHFCGVYALKPTWGVLSSAGHVPPPPGIRGEVDLGVMGPMARTPGDLRLLWRVLSSKAAGPAQSVKGRKVALWLDEPAFELGSEARAAVERAADVLKRKGADVRAAKPDIDMRAMMSAYLAILTPIMTNDFGNPAMAAAAEARNGFKAQLKAFYDEGWDAILAPVTPVPAFPHTQDGAMGDRTLQCDDRTISYPSVLQWISLATSLHPPALAAPAGRTTSGLPIGVQVIGQWNGEERVMDYADALDEAFGFAPPKGL